MTKYLLLLTLMVWLSGCAGGAGPSATAIPIVLTEGFHTGMPAAGTRAMFTEFGKNHRSGGDSYSAEARILEEFTARWLRHVGISVVASPETRWQLREEQQFRLRQEDADELRIGRMRGASQVIHLEIHDRSPEPPRVTIQAMAVETGEIVWSGSALMPRWPSPPESESTRRRHLRAIDFELLADWALATAFGFARSGGHPGCALPGEVSPTSGVSSVATPGMPWAPMRCGTQ